MPIPHGTLKDNHFTLRDPNGSVHLVLGSGGLEIIENLLRQGIIRKDEKSSRQGCWIYVPVPYAEAAAAA